ncbi:MAG: MATE family efflux transporter [Oscillospiraceae bacterium]|nr:MATE family efflux transporter [Oscillospiraceae bacterium]
MSSAVTENPLGTMPTGKLIFKYAVPAVISLLVSSLYNIVDQIFIGQGVGLLGNAATNVSFPVTTITTALALMIGIGTAANFNLKQGAGQRDEARRIAGNGLFFLIVFGVAIAAIIGIFLPKLLWAFGATSENYSYARDYTSITVFGLPLVIFSTGASYLIRSDGRPAYSMICTLSGAVLNTILDPIFIFPLAMGMKGAALATVIGQVVSAVMAAAYIIKTRLATVELDRRAFIPSGKILRMIVALGLAPCLTHVAMTIVQIVMNNTLTHYGELSVYGKEIPLAVVGVIMKVNTLLMGFTVGISQGCQPIFGYNFGHRNYSRTRETLIKGLGASIVISLVFFLCFQLFPRQIVSIFGTGSELYYEFAEKFFRIFLMLTFGNAVQPIIANFFNSIGKPIISIVLSMSRQIIFLVPALLIFPIFFGIRGVLFAGPITDAVSIILASVFLSIHLRRMPKDGEPV